MKALMSTDITNASTLTVASQDFSTDVLDAISAGNVGTATEAAASALRPAERPMIFALK